MYIVEGKPSPSLIKVRLMNNALESTLTCGAAGGYHAGRRIKQHPSGTNNLKYF